MLATLNNDSKMQQPVKLIPTANTLLLLNKSISTKKIIAVDKKL